MSSTPPALALPTADKRRWLIVMGAVVCLIPGVPAPAALALGIVLALAIGNPVAAETGKWAPKLLSWAIIGLGSSMNLLEVAKVGLHGMGYTAVGIGLTLVLGMTLGSRLGIDRGTSWLVAAGTAICGGSAIAATSVAMRAKPAQVSVALITVFLLNAVAVVIFPPLGHLAELTPTQFGLWAALAIHDTSSVVGAALQYGPEALAVGTTVKLARALWIVPVSIGLGILATRLDNSSAADGSARPKAKRPWFILGFLLAAAVVTFIPALKPAGDVVGEVARRLMVATLFLIGAGLTKERLKAAGLRPFIQGLGLWVIVASLSLAAIKSGLIAL